MSDSHIEVLQFEVAKLSMCKDDLLVIRIQSGGMDEARHVIQHMKDVHPQMKDFPMLIIDSDVELIKVTRDHKTTSATDPDGPSEE